MIFILHNAPTSSPRHFIKQMVDILSFSNISVFCTVCRRLMDREKPIIGRHHFETGNCLKDKNDNADKSGHKSYCGKYPKESVKTNVRTEFTKTPFRKNCSSFEMGKKSVAFDGNIGNARQVFEERLGREKLENRPKKGFVSRNVYNCRDENGCEMGKIDVPSRAKQNYARVVTNPNERDEKNKRLRLFRKLYELLKEEEGGNKKLRPDLEAWKAMKQSGKLPQLPRLFGPVKGVEIGDEFQFRVELVIVGLHSHHVNGIDYVSLSDGRVLATSIVATEGYRDVMVRPDVVMYTGEGGNIETKSKDLKDQELKRGNLALKNSIKEGNFVRVVRGMKAGSGNVNAKGGTQKAVFVYDGLYKVVSWEKIMGPFGKAIFQFELRRCSGQEAIVWQKYK